MTTTRIDFTPSDFPAQIDLHVPDGTDFIWPVLFILDGVDQDLSSGWTATFTVKKGTDYQDIEFSCDQTDHITLSTGTVVYPNLENNPSLFQEITEGDVNGDYNLRLKIPGASSSAFSFLEGVYSLELSNGTDTLRVASGGINMHRFTSTTAFTP